MKKWINLAFFPIFAALSCSALGMADPAIAAIDSLVADPSPVQRAQLEKALASAPATLKADVGAAAPTVRPYLVTLMCVQDDESTARLVQKYVGSRGTTAFNGWSGSMSPGKRMKHHDMHGCLSVTRIQNWRRVAANEFSFDVIFTADDSGESYLWQTVVHKEPDGTWLIA